MNLGPHLIIKERKIICICWKWEGDPKVHYLTWDKAQDDKAMLIAFSKVAEEADEMVAHYGDFFDLPWFRGRAVIQGLPPLPTYKTVDTKAWASKYFYFNSNKLDYLGQVLGHGKKLHTEWELWEQVMNGSTQALAYMVRYCQQDVKLLEKVWHDLRFCVAPKTHAGVFSGLDKWTCPQCGTQHVHKTKTRVTAHGHRQHQMKCDNEKCSSYYQIPDSVFETYKKAKAKGKPCRRKNDSGKA